jgi:hypothetical protein
MRPINGNKKARRLMILPEIGEIDSRSRPAALFREIAGLIASDRGGKDVLSKSELELVRRSAGLGVIADQMEHKLVSGEQIDIRAYSDVCYRQCRILSTLGLDRRARPINAAIMR